MLPALALYKTKNPALALMPERGFSYVDMCVCVCVYIIIQLCVAGSSAGSVAAVPGLDPGELAASRSSGTGI